MFSTCAQHVHCPNLELKSDRFHVVHGSVAPLAVDEGAELILSMMSHVFVLLTDLYNQWFRFVHSITKKQGTLVMAITHSFHDIRVDINDNGTIRTAISYVRTSKSRRYRDISF